MFHSRIVDSKRDEIMRIIIAIAEKTVPTEKIGQVFQKELKRNWGKKTHFKNPDKDNDEEYDDEEEECKTTKQEMEVNIAASSAPLLNQ